MALRDMAEMHVFVFMFSAHLELNMEGAFIN